MVYQSDNNLQVIFFNKKTMFKIHQKYNQTSFNVFYVYNTVLSIYHHIKLHLYLIIDLTTLCPS